MHIYGQQTDEERTKPLLFSIRVYISGGLNLSGKWPRPKSDLRTASFILTKLLIVPFVVDLEDLRVSKPNGIVDIERQHCAKCLFILAFCSRKRDVAILCAVVLQFSHSVHSCYRISSD